jgi:methylenetetrahydrofolate dehydrogenase (NADP+) / methenyltetrahydrofolate cyclohydrolase
MTKILKGKDVADALNLQNLTAIETLKEHHITPTLVTIRLGDRPDDAAYGASIVKKAKILGVGVEERLYPQNMTQKALENCLAELNQDDHVHGVLIFRPLPSHMDEKAVCNILSPQKDVDGISDVSMGRVYSGNPDGFGPCTAESVMLILNYYNIPIGGKRAVVLGRSLVIGKPVAMMLLGENATVTLCHRKTDDLPRECRRADILIAAAGKANFLDETFVHSNQVVIDVGINVDEKGNLCGDVDYDKVAPLVDAITPVPGGVGTVTTAILLEHVIRNASRQSK